MKKLLAVTACPTGIAHTYMAAESLQKAAGEKNVPIKVETRGAVGVENELTAAEIAEAHAIIIAADTDVDEARFAGKPIVKVAVAQGIKIPGQLIEQALALQASAGTAAPQAQAAEGSDGKRKQPVFYKHLMTGVSHMLPLVVAGGLLIAISFFKLNPAEGTFLANLLKIGGAAMGLMVPILAAFIAFSIGGRPALASGLVGGMLSTQLGAGFLGGILAGFLAGYVSKWLIKNIKLPRSMEGLKPMLIVPFLSVLVVGLLMVYVIGTPIKSLMDALTVWLEDIGSGNKIMLGAILGGMMALDMGGPFNKIAYTFAVGLLGSGVYGPMAAVMAAGMTPPLGIWLATVLAPKKFTKEEREAGKVASILGLSFITEGAIPFGAADPLRIIPAFMIGSGLTGALSMVFDVTLRAPHGGIFVLLVPNAISPVFMYLIAIAIGTVVTALLVNLFKKKTTSL
ncbi:PTS fructose transporter subunit IIC [Paenibacillus wynnii]|uniref:FruA n=1 Tax=Paenibacillus wynnii TaxID=268407 RepID=A0A098M931_9BACL|nr:fructose-specific PTS transporter subunit EIIC [Paenibacillus wynnii]KGE18037.1 FruA [Paenibacillus wynnii]